ncbi:MAG: uroporphyrinogen decarboxylase family protein [Candidatus Kryptoniota bacterium]
MKTSIAEWAASARASGKRLAVPIMTHPGIEMSGKTIIDAVSSGEAQYLAIKMIMDKYSPDAATMIMDLTVEAEAFGCKINLSNNEIPSVAEPLVGDHESIERLRIPSLDCARIPQYLNAAHLAATNISDKPVFAGCIGPFSLAGRLFGMTEIMTSLFIEPEMIKSLLDKSTSFLLSYIDAMKRLGTDGIIMAEPAAGLLSAEMCDEFSSAYVRRIVGCVQDRDFRFVLHNCGNTGQVTRSMISTDAGGLHFGNKINLTEALKEIPNNILVFGNLDPVSVFKSGTPEHVFDATTELLERTSGCNNFIISSGCDTPPGSPAENIDAFFRAVRLFNSGI